MDPVVALRARLGASWWSWLMRAGVSDGNLRGAVRRGLVTNLGGGVYALPDAPADVVAAATVRGRLTCCSAAKRHGFDLLRDPECAHVLVPRNRPAESPLAVVHRGSAAGTGPVVPAFAALLTVLRCLPALEAVVVVDSAVRQRAARVAGLRSRLRGPGSVEARRVLGLVDGRSGSLIETVLRLALRQAGLTVDCQVVIDGVGRVDLVIDGWLVVEVDGFAYHSQRSRYRLDRARANALAMRGYVLLRFTYEDVMHRLPETVATVLAVHARGR
jgi:very-short-patch-repair endonuclease